MGEQVSLRQEIAHLKEELNQSKLSLAEEKINHEQLKKSSSELEETIKVISECEEQRTKICEDLTLLKSKHKKCSLTESALKQSRREKKMLQKKYDNLRRKFDFLKILHDSLKEKVTEGNTPREDEGSSSNDIHVVDEDVQNGVITQLRNELAERDLIIKEYEEDHRNLMGKMEPVCNELEELRRVNRSLENKQEVSIESLNDSLKHMKICITDMNSNKNVRCNELDQANAKLSQLKQKISESESEVENLRGKVNDMEIIKLSNESEIASLRETLESARLSEQNGNINKTSEQYAESIDSLNLEKDILLSRVLILEGIGDEVEIL